MKKMWWKMLLSCVVVLSSAAFGARALYVGTADGHVVGLDGMNRGFSNVLGGAGDTSFYDLTLAGNEPVNFLAAGNETNPNGAQVVVAGGNGNVISLRSDLAVQLAFWDTNGPDSTDPVTGLAVGSYGPDYPEAVLCANGYPGGSTILLANYNLTYQMHRSYGIGGDYDIMNIVLADVEPSLPGNEAVFATGNLIAKDKDSTVGCVAYKDSTDKVKDLWGWMGTGNTISAIVAGELYPSNPASNDPNDNIGAEIVILGNSNDGAADPGAYGNGAQCYWRTAPPQFPASQPPVWRWWNNLDFTFDPNENVVAGVIADVLNDSGPEFISVGKTKLYISNGDPTSDQANRLQTIETNQPCTSVIVEDVLGNDGVAEIVVGTSSGIVLAYEYDNANDLFVIDDTYGGVFLLDPEGDGTEYQVTGLAAADVNFLCVPPPMDFNQDCIVDLLDFTEFAGYWLTDTRI